ncbi:hypothetical protein AXW83_09330 [Bosea sp. PAMC 26642]|nr:hypothetical protein AXW83_09330 [Bosea sp. PAMC 26642]
MGRFYRQAGPGPALALLAALFISGCASTPVQEASIVTSPSAPGAFPRDRLVGNWGSASFHNAKDRKRTEAEARAQCSQPYVIARGPSDGVMMHAADDPKIYELKLKGGAGGKTYLGFEAPAGDPQDREILSASDTMLVMRFVDPDVHKRYGTFVYVRCGR